MSLFRQIKTQINDRAVLVSALKGLGYSPCVGTNLTVRGDRRESASGFDVVLKKEHTNLKADIGFKRETDGTFTLGMDTYVIRDFTPQQFMSKVKEAFFVKKAQKQAASVGLESLSRQVIERNGRKVIRLQYVKRG